MSDQQTTVDITKIDAERGFFDEFKKPSKEEWKEEATAALKGAPFDKVMYTKTYEGLTIEPIYMAEDIEGLPHLKSKPGFQPFVRSTRPNGYIKAPWKINQELTLAFPQTFNEEARFDIARGQTGLNIVLDHPTRSGQSPANASEEDVGRDGVSLETLHDVSTIFQGIDLKTVPVQCFTGAISLPMLAMLSVAMQDNEAGVNHLHWVDGCVGSDPLAVLATEGKLPVSLKMAYDSMHQATAWAAKKAPKLQTIFVQGHPYHNAGAASTEEVAFALATAAEYLREMIQRGLSIDQVAPRIRFGFSLGSIFFMEIAKLRAARILWAQIVAAFGGNEDAQKMTIHGRTSAYNKTVFDPYVNMLRVTSEGFSGAVGGVDSMHLSPFDEPIRTPDRFSRRIARNVQVMLQEESRFTMPIDLGGGAVFEVLGPSAELVKEGSVKGYKHDPNNESVVGRLVFGSFTMMLTGDAEKKEEQAILAEGRNVQSKILKAGHHGSKTSSSADFLRAVQPEAALISCGVNNDYGHPHKETMKKYHALNLPIYVTAENGTITVTSDGKTYNISVEQGEKQ